MSCQIALELTLFLILIAILDVQCQFDFSKNSFRVQSQLYRVGEEEPVSIGFVAESYSNLQSRGKVEYRKDLASSQKITNLEATIYRDPDGFVVYDQINRSCREASLEFVDSLLALPSFVKPYEKATHIFGPARLLPWIQDQASRLKEDDILEDDCFLVYTLTQENQFDVQVYYSKFERMLSDWVQPKYVRIVSIRDHSNLTVEFRGFRHVADADDDLNANYEGNPDDDIWIDEFALPVVQCSGSLKDRKSNLLSKLIPLDEIASQGLPIEFSFRFKRSLISDEYGAHDLTDLNAISVAYDHRLQILALTNPVFSWGNDDQQQVRVNQVLQGNNIYYSVESAGNQKATNEHRVTFHSDNNLQKLLKRPDLVLFGNDKFISLGRAKIRGIKAQVYETSSSAAPLWLTRSIPVKTGKNPSSFEQRSSSVLPPGNLTILVYVGQQAGYRSVLAVELIRQEDWERFTYDIYDFSWNLADESGDFGEHGLNMLALRRSSDQQVQAIVQLGLVSSNWGQWKPNERFRALPTRNLGLLSAMANELEIKPWLGVVDFTSRLVVGTLGKQLTVSFTVMDNSGSRQLNLTALGKISIETGDPIINYYFVRDFSDCVALSTTIVGIQPIFFAFDEEEAQCFTIGSGEQPAHYKPGAMGNAELFVNYQVHTRVKPAVPLYKNMINRHISVSEFSSRIPPSGENLTIDDKSPDDAGKLPMFLIDKANIRRLISESDDDDDNDNDNQDDSVTNIRPEFPGFAIIYEDTYNRLVSDFNIHQADGGNKTVNVTSLATCESVCFADDQCQAFSFCLKPGQVKCFLSRLSFASQNITDKLGEARKKRKSNEVFELSVPLPGHEHIEPPDGQSVRVKLKKQANCELHNRMFMGYFKPSLVVKPVWEDAKTWPTNKFEGIEKCARLCFGQNLKFMREETNYNHVADTTRMNRHLRIMNYTCSNFHYITLSLGNGTINNYCYFDSKNERLKPSDDEAYPLPSKASVDSMVVREFDFRFELLYEKIDGVNLLPYTLSDELVVEYDLLLRDKKIEKGYLDTFIGLDMWGANLQTQSRYLRELDSARTCFLQDPSSVPWPACRSFDSVIDHVDSEWVHFRYSSQTLSKILAIKNATHRTVIYENKTEVRRNRRVHYEPRESLKLLQSILDTEYESDEKRQAAWTTFDTVGAVIVFFIGALIEVFLSAKLTHYTLKQRQYVARRQSRQSDGDRRNLGVHAEGDIEL